MNEEKSWLQRPGESDRQFELFTFFLSLEPERRTLQSVCEHFALSRVHISKIANKNGWVERSRAWNNHVAEKKAEASVQAAQDIAFDWWTWEANNNLRLKAITDGLLAQVEKMLALPVTKMERKKRPIRDGHGHEVRDAEGLPLFQEITIVSPTRWSLADIPKSAGAIVQLSEYLTIRGNHRRLQSLLPVASRPVEEMTIDEREIWIAELKRRREALVAGEPIDVGEQ